MRFLVPLAVIALSAAPPAGLPYDLDRPERVYKLPKELREISALTDVDEHTVACLHDEAARIYYFDLREGRVTRSLSFDRPGDLEGLTRVGDEFYALRSDGLLYRLRMKDDGLRIHDTVRLALPQTNLEGLGYDARHGLILVAPKNVVKGAPAARDRRLVHAFDPKAGRLVADPVLDLSVQDIVRQARRAGIPVPARTTDKGKEVVALKLRFSSVAVDPIADHYYLLSALDRVLLVVDRKGVLVALHALDKALFPKPEGLTFLPSGTLLISNEGVNTAPTILRFPRIKG